MSFKIFKIIEKKVDGKIDSQEIVILPQEFSTIEFAKIEFHRLKESKQIRTKTIKIGNKNPREVEEEVYIYYRIKESDDESAYHILINYGDWVNPDLK